MWRVVLAVCASALLLFAGSAVWQASRALRLTENDVKSSSLIRFTRGTVERAPAAGFEILQTPASFTDAISFNGHLVVSGSAGLFEYDADGTLIRSHRAGLELPAAPVVAMALGALADGTGQELLENPHIKKAYLGI